MEELSWMKGMKKKVEEELAKKEMETVVYWKGEIEKTLAKRPDSLGTFQMEIKNLIQRMQNRIKVVKSNLS